MCDSTSRLVDCDIYDNENNNCFKCKLGYEWNGGTSTCDILAIPIPNNCTSVASSLCNKCKNDHIYDAKSNKCIPRGVDLAALFCLKGIISAAGALTCQKCWSSH